MSAVKNTRISLLVLITFICQPPTESALQFALGFRTAITVVQHTVDVTEFASKIGGFINSKENNGNEVSEEIIKATEVLIAASTTKLLNAILLQSKLDRVEDAVVAIHSSLIDVRKIIKADSKTTLQTYVNDFVRFFEQHETMKHIRFLPELLTYRIPGLGSGLLSEITQKTRCNMTALREFADFYLKLVSDGIALQLLYYKFTTSLSFEQVLKDEWPGAIAKIQRTFNEMVKSCFDRFPTFAQEDVNNANNIDNLAIANRQRYLFRWSDVIFYASVGTEQFHFMKFKTGRLFRHKNDHNNKVAVFGRRGEPMAWNAADIETKLKKANFNKPSGTDETAAKVVASDVEQYIKSLGYSIGAILVFFDGEDFEATGIRTDTGSPVVKYVMDGITLEYCFDSGAECAFRDKVTSMKDSTGKFWVYIYPTEAGDSDEYETDGAATLAKLPLLVLEFILCFAQFL